MCPFQLSAVSRDFARALRLTAAPLFRRARDEERAYTSMPFRGQYHRCASAGRRARAQRDLQRASAAGVRCQCPRQQWLAAASTASAAAAAATAFARRLPTPCRSVRSRVSTLALNIRFPFPPPAPPPAKRPGAEVLQAEASHDVFSPHPIFFYFLQDPVAEAPHESREMWRLQHVAPSRTRV